MVNRTFLQMKPCHFSLSREYFIFSLVILFMIFVLSFFYYFYALENYNDEKNEMLRGVANNVHEQIKDIFEEASTVMSFLGEKISKDPSDDNIAHVLSNTGNLNLKSMANSYVSWARPDGKLVVAKEGPLKGIFPDISNREYFVSAKQKPWTLQVSRLTQSSFTKSLILPTAMGVTDSKGRFLGYLILGLKINLIESYLNRIHFLDKIGFVLLDHQKNVICKSNNNPKKNYDLFLATVGTKIAGFENKDGFLEPMIHGSMHYCFYKKFDGYPYIILTGFDQKIFDRLFYLQIVPRLCECVFMGIFCMILLYFFRKQIIKPISELAFSASQISQGNLNIKVPRHQAIEIHKLSGALLSVVRFINKNTLYKKKLELANRMIKDSDAARETFVRSISRELSCSLKEIMAYTRLSLEKIGNGIVDDDGNKEIKVMGYLHKVMAAANMLHTKTSNVVAPSYFEVNKLIEDSIKINLKLAVLKDISLLKITYSEEVQIYADELMFKQILVSLIAKAIQDSPRNTKVSVSTSVYVKENSSYFQISIQDQGFGLNEEELNSIQKNLGKGDESFLLENSNINLTDIKKIVEAHYGECYLETRKNNGRCVRLVFPHLRKKEFSQMTGKKDNIIYFQKAKEARLEVVDEL